MDYDEESIKDLLSKPSRAHELAAVWTLPSILYLWFYFVYCPKLNESVVYLQNSQKGRFFGLQKIGLKKIPEHVRCHKQTDLEIAKAALLLSSLPKSLPCRDKYVRIISLKVFLICVT